MSKSRNFAAACLLLSAFVFGGCHKQPIAATPPAALTSAPISANPDGRPAEQAASDQPKPKPSQPPLIPKDPQAWIIHDFASEKRKGALKD